MGDKDTRTLESEEYTMGRIDGVTVLVMVVVMAWVLACLALALGGV